MTCLTPPQSVADFMALVNTCATAYGGADWPRDALYGLVTLALALLAIVLVAARRQA